MRQGDAGGLARNGGENPLPLSRFIAGADDDTMQVRQIWRTDRMGRGGDQPAPRARLSVLRFPVAVENTTASTGPARGRRPTAIRSTWCFPSRQSDPLNVRVLAVLASAPDTAGAAGRGGGADLHRVSWKPVYGVMRYRIYQSNRRIGG